MQRSKRGTKRKRDGDNNHDHDNNDDDNGEETKKPGELATEPDEKMKRTKEALYGGRAKRQRTNHLDARCEE